MKAPDPNSKSGFIRANLSLTNEELIAAGKKAGHDIKPNLIYMVRSQAKNGAAKKPKMRKVRASAMRKKAPRAKRKYTRRAPVAASNGKVPVSVSALVQKFVADLQAVNKQLLRDQLEGVI